MAKATIPQNVLDKVADITRVQRMVRTGRRDDGERVTVSPVAHDVITQMQRELGALVVAWLGN